MVDPASDPVSSDRTSEPASSDQPSAGSPYDFPTEALLDAHAVAADSLRTDLAELRRQLDIGPPPLRPPSARNRKPLIVALGVCAAAAAITAAVLLPWSGPETNLDTGRPAADGVLPGPDVDLGQAPRSTPPGRLPTTGPGISGPGTMMLVQVGANGRLDVIEQAVFGPLGLGPFGSGGPFGAGGPLGADTSSGADDKPHSGRRLGSGEIALRLPSTAALGGRLAELAPTVHDLRVAVDGTPVPITSTVDHRAWAAVADPERTRTVRLSYRIEDAVVRTRPSTAGRALGVSQPLLGQALRDQGLPLVVQVEGRPVSGVSCPGAPLNTMLCGQQVDGGWRATVPAEALSPTLLLQLTLA